MPNFLLRAVGLGFIVVLRKLIHAKKCDLLSDYQAPKRLFLIHALCLSFCLAAPNDSLIPANHSLVGANDGLASPNETDLHLDNTVFNRSPSKNQEKKIVDYVCLCSSRLWIKFSSKRACCICGRSKKYSVRIRRFPKIGLLQTGFTI